MRIQKEKAIMKVSKKAYSSTLLLKILLESVKKTTKP